MLWSLDHHLLVRRTHGRHPSQFTNESKGQRRYGTIVDRETIKQRGGRHANWHVQITHIEDVSRCTFDITIETNGVLAPQLHPAMLIKP